MNPEDVMVFEGYRYEGCFPENGQTWGDSNYHHDGPFVLKSDFDQLRQEYKELKWMYDGLCK